MASLFKLRDMWAVKYYLQKGKSQKIYLGKVSERTAQRLCAKLETLINCKLSGSPLDASTKEWVASLSNTPLGDKLVKAGLTEKQLSRTLKDFLHQYVEIRKDLKKSSKVSLKMAVDRLIEFFGEDARLDQINAGQAEEYRIHLLQLYAPATAGRTLRSAIQFFDYAISCNMITVNPFKKLKMPKQTNEAKMFFVTGEVTQKLLGALKDPQKKIAFALARYGGIRIPSELHKLEWDHVNWDKGTILIHSPKTEHHAGKDKRIIPLFPELREILQEAYRTKDPEEKFVCGRIRGAGINLRTVVSKTLLKLGIKPWPKLFVNLRSSRETELVDNFPLHVVTKWIGHTPDVAKMHYLQVLDRHWQSAVDTKTVYQKAPEGKEDQEK